MLQRASEYSIRALAYLSQQPAGSFLLARDMAERLGIPAPYLAKILQPLVGRGLIESQRGRRGGFRLLRAAEQVRLYDIVDALEPLGRVRHCLLGQAECTDERACPLHQYWKPAAEEYLRVLSETSLADLQRFCEERPDCGYPCPPLDLASPSLGADALLPDSSLQEPPPAPESSAESGEFGES